MAQTYPAPKERLLSAIEMDPNSGCWLWTKALDHGYGRIRVNGKDARAHRASYKIFRGEIPIGMFVCHKCDTPACVNPDHLFLGYAKENHLDMENKGRMPIGNNHKSSVLSENQVLEIHKRYSSRESVDRIASDYGVHPQTVRAIGLGRNWKHITSRVERQGDLSGRSTEKTRATRAINLLETTDV